MEGMAETEEDEGDEVGDADDGPADGEGGAGPSDPVSAAADRMQGGAESDGEAGEGGALLEARRAARRARRRAARLRAALAYENRWRARQPGPARRARARPPSPRKLGSHMAGQADGWSKLMAGQSWSKLMAGQS